MKYIRIPEEELTTLRERIEELEAALSEHKGHFSWNTSALRMKISAQTGVIEFWKRKYSRMENDLQQQIFRLKQELLDE